ncbi:MAG: hypothetical protein CM1200mP39_10030 [Dehalococcoidia bacterium]|nr:MAG: hypothetical protein CM1200mP39_10030 [Dehalococcoidia bacterium]
MKILLLGGNGELGPHVVKTLEKMHTLRITDINNLETDHEYIKVDSSDLDQVVRALKTWMRLLIFRSFVLIES